MELYVISTLLKAYRGRKDVRVHWRATARANSPGDYREMIQDYDDLCELGKRAAEEYADSLFTKSECDVLTNYLNSCCGLKSDIYLLEMTPIIYEPDNFEITLLQDAKLVRLTENPIPGVAVGGYYDLDQCDPAPALMDALAEYPLEIIPRTAGGMANQDRCRRFFSAFGKLTGIYFREEDGRLRTTLGDERSFTGSLSDLLEAIEFEMGRVEQ